MPSVRIRDNLELKAGGYAVKVKGMEVASGELVTWTVVLAIDPGSDSVIEPVDGLKSTDPVFGLPCRVD